MVGGGAADTPLDVDGDASTSLAPPLLMTTATTQSKGGGDDYDNGDDESEMSEDDDDDAGFDYEATVDDTGKVGPHTPRVSPNKLSCYNPHH